MALPFIGFILLLGLVFVLYFIGFSRNNVNAGFAFMILASVVLIATSLFVMSEGLQLNQVEAYVEAGLTTSITYVTANYSLSNWTWLRVLIDVLFYSGFVGIIFGFVYSFKKSKASDVDEWGI